MGQDYGGKVLFPYQEEGKEFLKARPKAGLWDDMGLGKTIQALAAAKDLDLLVEVIGPPKLALDWKAEAENLGVPLKYHSFSKIPTEVGIGCILIFEEAHWLQGGDRTARGRKGLELGLWGSQSRTWLLTGTPMRNGRPVNLKPLLEILGIIPEKIESWDYLNRYCGPRTLATGRKIITVFDGATNLKDLALLTAPVSLRRLKTEVLDLPEKIRCHREVPLEDRMTVSRKLKDFKKRLATMLEEKDRLDTRDSLEKLLIVSQLKMASETDKLMYCKDLAEELEGQFSLWFCCYLETGKRLAKELNCPLISGETGLEERDAIIKGYQAGRHRNLVLTIRAAGVGITLTKATNVVFVGKEWAPEDNAQAEDRAYRIGQVERLTVFDLESSLDRHVVNLHKAKDGNTKEFFESLKSIKA